MMTKEQLFMLVTTAAVIVILGLVIYERFYEVASKGVYEYTLSNIFK